MFGGIISCKGVIEFDKQGRLCLRVRARTGYFNGVEVGQSIAVNGVCLTVVSMETDNAAECLGCGTQLFLFRFDVSQETKLRTTINQDCLNGKRQATFVTKCNHSTTSEVLEHPPTKGHAITGCACNVEIPLRHGEFLGGHYVQGHVHQVGVITSISPDQDERNQKGGFVIHISPSTWTNEIRYKDSVAVNGVSLTIASVNVEQKTFSITLLPHTIANTTFDLIKQGDKVNLEFASHPIVASDDMSVVTTDVDPKISNVDAYYMKRALECGERGRCTAPPNPWVGCVLVRNNIVIGEGHHEKAGEPHAEINAFRNAQTKGCESLISGCTLYVTLEPCSHQGRTPPCDAEIIRRGVKRVVIGVLDPDTRVSGRGRGHLLEAGIEVVVMNDADVKESLHPYLHQRKTGLPLVVMKVALSLDGAIVDPYGESQWISGIESRHHAHAFLRAHSQAIMVGSRTAIRDHPSLTVRLFDKHSIGASQRQQPLRVVVDSDFHVPHQGPLFEDMALSGARTLVVGTNAQRFKEMQSHHDHVTFALLPSAVGGEKKVPLKELLAYLAKNYGILQVLVEGGAGLHGAFFEQNLVDELVIYSSAKILGRGAKMWNEFMPPSSVASPASFQLHHTSSTTDGDVIKTLRKIPRDDIDNRADSENKEAPLVVEDRVTRAVETFRQGGMVLVLDDENRENEGDLILAGSTMTEQQMIFLLKHTTGLVCVSISSAHASQLALPRMCVKNTDNHQTAFTVTCDHVSTGTGVSALDRLATVRALSLSATQPQDLRRPGHILPLIAREGLLSERRGHTEAGQALCKLAGLSEHEGAILAELQNHESGHMMRRDECYAFAQEHNIPIVTIDELQRADVSHVSKEQVHKKTISIQELASCSLHLPDTGEWKFTCYGNAEQPHRVVVFSDKTYTNVFGDKIPFMLRLHSECFTGDVLHSQHCDCGEQLQKSMQLIREHGRGGVIMLAGQEGRGMGLVEKVKAYRLQQEDASVDTFLANTLLGHHEDARNYKDAVEILTHLQIDRVILLSENPEKRAALEQGGISILEIRPVLGSVNSHNAKYLRDKRSRFFYLRTNKII